MRYSIEPKDRICICKGYRPLSIAKNMSNKYGQNFRDSAKKSAKYAIKTA